MVKLRKNNKSRREDADRANNKRQESPLSREGFFKMLRKISRPKDEKSSEEKSETSE